MKTILSILKQLVKSPMYYLIILSYLGLSYYTDMDDQKFIHNYELNQRVTELVENGRLPEHLKYTWELSELGLFSDAKLIELFSDYSILREDDVIVRLLKEHPISGNGFYFIPNFSKILKHTIEFIPLSAVFVILLSFISFLSPRLILERVTNVILSLMVFISFLIWLSLLL